MPFIIWGSRGITSRLDGGTFFCPHCNQESDYDLMQSRPFFTIFFIPIFPIGGAQQYVQCCQCQLTYQEAVLDMAATNPEDQFLRQVLGELNTGSSLELVQRKIEAAGIASDQARHFIDEMTQGKTWCCDKCGDHYLRAVTQCLRCKA